MALLTGWMDDARRGYSSYGVDLIRTGCLLLRTTPSVTYRAAVLFQRFQAVAEQVRRKRGDYQDEYSITEGNSSRDVPSGARKMSYTVPIHVGTERPSGVLMFGDPYAPLDYCLFNLREHDDITYLTAACVLIATKMEDHSMRVRLIVGVFMRLNQRRRGEPVIEQLQPPPERYDDFKSCILEAEEVVLQALGFQTFVESPFKYAILFLGMLIEEDKVGVAADTGTTESNTFYFNGLSSNLVLKKWLADAVSWLNDIPRCVELYAEEAHVLAVCSLFATRPSNITALPENWSLAFGLERTKLNAVLRLHRKHLEEAVNSGNKNVQLLIETRQTKPCYPTATAEGTPTPAPAVIAPTAGNPPEAPPSLPPKKTTELVPPVASSSGIKIPSATPPLVVPPVVAPFKQLESLHSALQLNFVPRNNPGMNNNNNNNKSPKVTGSTTKNVNDVGNYHPIRADIPDRSMPTGGGVTVVPRQPIEEEFHFEDLKELQRRRRQEEENEEKRTKRRRSSSHRRRHHSGERRKRRSSDRQREESRGGRKRRHSQGGHKSHRNEQQQQHRSSAASQHSRSDRRDERQRHDNRPRHDDRQRHGGRQRNNGKQRRER
ncbi:hypothetical protein MOQ_003489 [Trypanosoma cruzi marinkellei]|uniref:Cyclin 12, L-type n=1 Tax=Trypanosoma cruzi marinkellei TaxID=85056 RepID=K2NUM6_TRYCR|nr:hypothetical protein MOQ_003489 [Trypanosoma cruzi marinkellei]